MVEEVFKPDELIVQNDPGALVCLSHDSQGRVTARLTIDSDEYSDSTIVEKVILGDTFLKLELRHTVSCEMTAKDCDLHITSLLIRFDVVPDTLLNVKLLMQKIYNKSFSYEGGLLDKG